MKKRILLIVAAVVVLFAAFVGMVLFKANPQGFSGFAMGSVFNGTLWAVGLPFPGLSSDFNSWFQHMEEELINAKEPPALALEIMEASDGAFNPYLGALVKLWNINDEPYLPTQEEIAEALLKNGIDLGAYGKGAACDKALDRFEVMAVNAAVINLGGNIATYGKKPLGQPFKIALRDPLGGPNDTMGVFTLRGTHFISTSGSYEKYFERDGVKYHHIFDPETGCPACRDPGLVSVTVISTGEYGGAIGDMVSTACFVLGYEASFELMGKYFTAALFIYEDGTVKNAGHTWDYFKLTNPSYQWSYKDIHETPFWFW